MSAPTIYEDSKKDFIQEFIDAYLERGFGSMLKSDIDILVFHLLKKYSNLKDMSNGEASLSLKLPESRVRNYAYQASLKYSQYTKDDIRKLFFSYIKNAKLEYNYNKEDYLLINIEDKYLVQTLCTELKRNGYTFDFSFNSEKLVLRREAMIFLIDYVLENDVKKTILKECNNVISSKDKLPSFKSLLGKYLEGVATKTGEITMEGFVTLATGGMVGIAELAKSLSKIIIGGLRCIPKLVKNE